MHDSAGEAYYYNPATVDMSWKMPLGCVPCAKCEEKFCARRCNAAMKFFCIGCWEKHHESKTSEAYEALQWKELDGGETLAADIDVEKLPSKPSRRTTLTPERPTIRRSMIKVKKSVAVMSQMRRMSQMSAALRRKQEMDKKTAEDGKPKLTLLEEAQNRTKVLIERAEVRAIDQRERSAREGRHDARRREGIDSETDEEAEAEREKLRKNIDDSTAASALAVGKLERGGTTKGGDSFASDCVDVEGDVVMSERDGERVNGGGGAVLGLIEPPLERFRVSFASAINFDDRGQPASKTNR